MRDPDRFLRQLLGLFDVMHHQARWPLLSPWWQETIADAERSGTRQRVIRKGRRIGASTIIAPVVAVCEALHGQHEVPPNDVGYFLFFSVKKDEALKRLRGIGLVLTALRVRYRESGDTITLQDRAIAFKVQPASFRTAVGDTSIGTWCDELSRWQDSDSGANPASEVLASVRPTMATMPNAKLWLVSSPLSTLDAHAAAFELGNTNAQRVYFCPTWVGNPTLTEEATRALEPDERVWSREYAAIPQDSLGSAFPVAIVEAAFRDPADELKDRIPAGAFGLEDFASGRRDAAVSMVARFWIDKPEPRFLTEKRSLWSYAPPGSGQPATWEEPLLDPDGEPIPNPNYREPRAPLLRVERILAAEGSFWTSLPADQLVAQRAAFYRQHGVATIFGDQREAYLLQSAYGRHGLRYLPLTWTSANKPAAVERLRRWLVERLILLPDHSTLRRELLGFKERVLPSGHITFDGGTGHDDFVACLVTCALAELEGLLPSSPLSRVDSQRARNESFARFINHFGGEVRVDEQGRLQRKLPVVR